MKTQGFNLCTSVQSVSFFTAKDARVYARDAETIATVRQSIKQLND